MGGAAFWRRLVAWGHSRAQRCLNRCQRPCRCSEAQELLAYATSLGLGLADVELALVLAGGDWDEARVELQEQAEAAAVAASTAEAEAALRAAAAAGSREEADLQTALQASTSSAVLAYNTAMSAAAAAAAAREQADLAAALEASRADEEARQAVLRLRQQQQLVLPWTVPSPSFYSLGSHDSAADQQAGVHVAPAQQAAAPAQQQQELWFFDEATRASLPTHAGGWGVGPAAAVAAASGRSTSACASPPAVSWQQLSAKQPAGLPREGLVLPVGTVGVVAAAVLQPSDPALPNSLSPSPSLLPLPTPPAEDRSSLVSGSEWGVHPPALAASKDPPGEVEDLMALMGID